MSRHTARSRRAARRTVGATVAGAGLVLGTMLAMPTANAAAAVPNPLCTLLHICPTGNGPTASTPVAITGTPKVGMVLTATPPVWDDTTTVTTYQWMRGTTAIASATTAKYTLVPADVGQQLTVVATGTISAGSTKSTSTAVTGVIGDPPKPNATPAVTGIYQVGQTVTVAPGTWSGDPQPTFTFQWYRSSGSTAVAIPGATSAAFALTSADVGHKVAALVTATRPGYMTGTAASDVVSLEKKRSSSLLMLSKVQIKVGTKAKAWVTVLSTDGTPTGRVTVYDRSRTLKTVNLTGANDGRVSIVLPKLAKGSHSIKVKYAGNDSIAGSTSKTVTLKVTAR